MHEREGKWKGKVGWIFAPLIDEEKVEGEKRKPHRLL